MLKLCLPLISDTFLTVFIFSNSVSVIVCLFNGPNANNAAKIKANRSATVLLVVVCALFILEQVFYMCDEVLAFHADTYDGYFLYCSTAAQILSVIEKHRDYYRIGQQ